MDSQFHKEKDGRHKIIQATLFKKLFRYFQFHDIINTRNVAQCQRRHLGGWGAVAPHPQGKRKKRKERKKEKREKKGGKEKKERREQ